MTLPQMMTPSASATPISFFQQASGLRGGKLPHRQRWYEKVMVWLRVAATTATIGISAAGATVLVEPSSAPVSGSRPRTVQRLMASHPAVFHGIPTPARTGLLLLTNQPY